MPDIVLRLLIAGCSAARCLVMQIAGNTGSIARTCAASSVGLHLIEVALQPVHEFNKCSNFMNTLAFSCFCLFSHIHLPKLLASIFSEYLLC